MRNRINTIKLLPNGLTVITTLDTKQPIYKSMQEAVGDDCTMVDIVECHGLGEMLEYCLVCDEEFLLKGNPVVNPIASYFYGLQDHGQPLCGNVLIMKNKYTEDGLETVGLEAKDIAKIQDIIAANFSRAVDVTQ